MMGIPDVRYQIIYISGCYLCVNNKEYHENVAEVYHVNKDDRSM